MYMEYLLYLNTISKAERDEQLLMITIFLIIILILAGGVELLKYKFKNKAKNKKFYKLFNFNISITKNTYSIYNKNF